MTCPREINLGRSLVAARGLSGAAASRATHTAESGALCCAGSVVKASDARQRLLVAARGAAGLAERQSMITGIRRPLSCGALCGTL